MVWFVYYFFWFINLLIVLLILPLLVKINDKYKNLYLIKFLNKKVFSSKLNFFEKIFFIFFYSKNDNYENINDKILNPEIIYHFRRNKFILSKELWYLKYHWIHNSFLILSDFRNPNPLIDEAYEVLKFPINFFGYTNYKYSDWKLIMKNLKKKKNLFLIFSQLNNNYLGLSTKFNISTLFLLNYIFIIYFARIDLMDLNMFKDLIVKHKRLYNSNVKTSINFENFINMYNKIPLVYYSNFLKNNLKFNSTLKSPKFNLFWMDVFNNKIKLSKNTKWFLKLYNLFKPELFTKMTSFYEKYLNFKQKNKLNQSMKHFINFFNDNFFLEFYKPFIKDKKTGEFTTTTYFWWESINNFLASYKSIIIIKKFLTYQQNKWKLRFQNPNLIKNTLNLDSKELENNYKIFFIRKNRIFNKNRYSRNRQLYRTGFYWCLWFSIFIGYGFLFLFYRFTINFGYFWWLLYLGLNVGFFVKIIKYRFYNIKIFSKEIIKNLKWAHYFINLIISQFFKTINITFKYILRLIIFFKKKIIIIKIFYDVLINLSNLYLRLIDKYKYYELKFKIIQKLKKTPLPKINKKIINFWKNLIN